MEIYIKWGLVIVFTLAFITAAWAVTRPSKKKYDFFTDFLTEIGQSFALFGLLILNLCGWIVWFIIFYVIL